VFDPGSRYYKIADATYTQPDGAAIAYKLRRFVPQPERVRSPTQVVVDRSDRLDLIAFRALGNPVLFWRVADANGAMDPFALTAVPGTTLRVPVPQT
jgi:nucleoid-associated protein YgaU